MFIQQGGRNRHEHICEALELFASEVMPEFRAREVEREKQKQEELAPYIEKAMARKQAMKPMRDEEIPVYVALGRKIAEEGTGTERQKQNAKLWADAAKVTLSDPLRHNPKATAATNRKWIFDVTDTMISPASGTIASARAPADR